MFEIGIRVDDKTDDEYYQQPMLPHKISLTLIRSLSFLAVLLSFLTSTLLGQATQSAKVELGSQTAKHGFQNETEIQNKFNDWKADPDARAWLSVMGYKVADIESVKATKPHGEKADVEITVKTIGGSRTDGISIKLVSSPNGFNQIDKRWLSHYASMWKMPSAVYLGLKLFVGETPPVRPGRTAGRMYLNELEPEARAAIISFFELHKDAIVSDLFQGDGPHAAGWVMVAFKATDKTRWTLWRVADVIRFYSQGPVAITSGGNLKIGRITMQRKGGDAGRDTAKMLQFKINPALLFDRP